MAINQFRVPTLDSSGKIPTAYLPSELRSFDWLFSGALTVRVGQARAIIPNNGSNALLARVTASLGTFSTSDTELSIQGAVRVNGLLAAQFTLNTTAAIIDQDVTPDQLLYTGDIVTVDILSVATAGGSYLVPSDLTVQAWWRWA
jgi:hypothetical protein